ncbi:hypothetical protein BUB20358_06812 [Burkholderia ubonensis]|nr:hypothetical protein BUB20358_06812 [Burkholderia ubonensis]
MAACSARAAVRVRLRAARHAEQAREPRAEHPAPRGRQRDHRAGQQDQREHEPAERRAQPHDVGQRAADAVDARRAFGGRLQEQRHVVVLQPLDAVRDEILDHRRHRAQVDAGPVADVDRGRRRPDLVRERVVLGDHDLHARDHHALDVLQRARQVLRHAVQVAHALLGRRRHQPLLLEQLAEARMARLRQSVRAQHRERRVQVAVGDADLPRVAVRRVARVVVLRRVDARFAEHRDHLVRVGLRQARVQLLLAAGEQHEQAREQRTRRPAAPRSSARRRIDHRHRLSAVPSTFPARAALPPRAPRCVTPASSAPCA